jgi:hypothetical protein
MAQNDTLHTSQPNEQERLASQRKKLQALEAQECATRLLHCCRCQAICWFFQETQDYWGCLGLGCTYARPLVESLDEHPDLRVYRGLKIRLSGKTAYAIYDPQARRILSGMRPESLDQARIEIDKLTEQRDVSCNEEIVRRDRATFRYPPYRIDAKGDEQKG